MVGMGAGLQRPFRELSITGQEWNFGTVFMAGTGNKRIERRGRPQSIPVAAHESVFRMHSMGYGSRRIARVLEDMGVYSTKSSVSRLLLGQGAYQSIEKQAGS